jgi:hypothetical protein
VFLKKKSQKPAFTSFSQPGLTPGKYLFSEFLTFPEITEL